MEFSASAMLQPENVIRYENASHGFDGLLVLDSTLLGPASGGIRILPDVREAEVRILARSMTLKNAFYDIPAGGAKVGIKLEPGSDRREQVLAVFAAQVSDLIRRFRYVPSPDMGCSESDVIRIYRQLCAESLLRNSVLFRRKDQCPLARLCTAEGVVESLTIALSILDRSRECLTVGIEGFGRLGRLIALKLAELHFRITAISDIESMLLEDRGIDLEFLTSVEQAHGKAAFRVYAQKSPAAEIGDPHSIVSQPVDILIPASRPHMITRSNANRIQSKVIVPCANAPVEEDAEALLAERGITVVPDLVSNAGGVLAGFFSRFGVPTDVIRQLVRKKIGEGVARVLKTCDNTCPGEVARRIAFEKLQKARQCRSVYRFSQLWHWRNLVATPIGLSSMLWFTRHRLRL